MPGGGWHGARWPIGADDNEQGAPSAAVSVVSGIAKVGLTSRSGAVTFYAAYGGVVVRPPGNPSHTTHAQSPGFVPVNRLLKKSPAIRNFGLTGLHTLLAASCDGILRNKRGLNTR
jgi:hypothetical protein